MEVAGVTFAIYAEQEGGAPLWMETQNVTFEEGGKYTVLLGASSKEGVPVELFCTGQPRWLGVEGPDIQEPPRVLIVSVPYALKAADAETLGGLPASAFVLARETPGGQASGGAGTTATAGAGTASMQTAAGSSPASTNVGTEETTKPKTAVTTITTSTNLVAKFDTTGTNVVPSSIFESNGNVGIGTTNPTAALHVSGNTVLVNGGSSTAQVQVMGVASSGRFGQDAGGAFVASDSAGSALRFLTNNGSLNEWMRIGSSGNVNIGSAQVAQVGEAVFAPDNVDRVHSVIGQAGSQYHFRLSRAAPDVDGFNDFLIVPYVYGMAMEYPGTLEVWSGNFSVHKNPRYSPLNRGVGANLWVGDEIDSGGLFVTALDKGGGTASTVVLAADRFNHTSHGSMNFVVRNTADAFRFDVGPYGGELMRGQISGTATGSSLDLFSGTVQATLRAQGAASGSETGGGTTAGGVQLGSTSNDTVSLFTNNGAAQVTLFPSGNFSIGNTTDTAPLAVGSGAQFQVSAAGAATIGGGTAITRHLSVSAALAFPQFAPGTCNTLTVNVPGAADENTVALGIPNTIAGVDGLEWFGWVSAADTVSVRLCNLTNQGVPAPPAGSVRVDVWQH
jgi:hypothetical protein